MKLAPHEFDAFTRLDFWVFAQRVFAELEGENFDDNFHIQLLCSEVDRVRTQGAIRLAVAMPPRSLKSIIISVALPAWLLGHDPETEVICVSYGQDLAEKLATDCRQIMTSGWYRRLFPKCRLDRQALGNLKTTRGGTRIATSVGGVLTGFGADVIIVDDPMKPEEAFSDLERATANRWARHTLFTRLNDKSKGSIIIVMQRLHEDDLIGHIRNLTSFELLSFAAIAQADEFHSIRTPFGDLHHLRREGDVLHPAREPREVIEQQRLLLGTEFFAAQYLQSPTRPGGGIVKSDWFRRYDPSHKLCFNRVLQSWDTASKSKELSNYSVCTTWGVTASGNMYLLHVFRDRLEYPDLKRKVIDLAITFNTNLVLIEDAASGVQLYQELRLALRSEVRAIRPHGEKSMRMRSQTAVVEAGKVWVPDHAPWLADYLHELEMFPNGRYDDQVDSTSQALEAVGMPTSADNWIEYCRREVEQAEIAEIQRLTRGQVPSIRLNHPHLNANLVLTNGREPRRETDGSFLVAPCELDAALSIRGVYRIPS